MDITNLDLKLLLAFEAMLNSRNVTLAADTLGLTQPAMSTALGKLRKLLGDPLFVRTSHGMEPTPYAAELSEPIRDALDLIRRAVTRGPSFDPATSDRTFTLIMTDIGERVFLPPLMQRLKAVAPHVNIKAVHVALREMREALASGEMDLALGFIPDLEAGFYQQRLFGQSYVCMMRADHPHIKKTLSLKQFLDASHAVISSEGTGHEVIERVLREKGLTRRIALHVTRFLALPPIIANTDLIVTIPRALGVSYATVANVKLLKPPVEFPSFDVKQHWHERYHRDPANRWLRELMAALFMEKARARRL